MNTKFNLYY